MKKLILLMIFPLLLLSSTNILPLSEVFIDKNSTYTIDTISDANFKAFETLGTPKINLGYISDTVWLKFSLSNTTMQPLKKHIVLDNQMLDHITLFTKEQDSYKKEVLGVLHPRTYKENILDFHFKVELESYETKEFYLKVSSLSCAVYFTLEFMEKSELLKNEFNHQMILNMFFISILTLIIYNIFIYFFTKNIEYVYYVLYLFFTIWTHGSYTGMSYLLIGNILPPNFIEIDAYLAIFYMSFVSIFAILFTRVFLNIKKYKKIDLLFKSIISVNIVFLFFTSPKFYPLEIISFLLFLCLTLIVMVSYYLFYKKESNAKYFVLGWTIGLIGWIMLGTYSYGIFSLIENYPYFYEATVFIEAILFSMVLSSKLNTTDKLKQQVSKNQVLAKELHHRVKNNMQFIISLYRLKLNEQINKEIDLKLRDVENSIKAMSNIHEILYDRDDLENINTNEYFNILVQEIQNTYKDRDVSISLHCNLKIDIQKAIYCGIILNELVSNSFKYAFKNNSGKIKISLEKKEEKNILIIEDNGVGCDLSKSSNGFGLDLVKSLVENELTGDIEIESDNKMKTTIKF